VAGICKPDACAGNSNCFNTGLGGTILPLAWTNGYLVIAATDKTTLGTGGGYIHFFDPVAGKLVTEATADNVGELRGLATLGNSGKVAFTNTHRVSVVGSNGKLDSTAESCVRNQSPLTNAAHFGYGPTLLTVGDGGGTGNWRFAMPMNDVVSSPGINLKANAMAYAPYQTTNANRCVRNTTSNPWKADTHLVWAPTYQISGVYSFGDRRILSTQPWNPTNSSWEGWSSYELNSVYTEALSLAADGTSNNIWAQIQLGSSASTVLRLSKTGGGPSSSPGEVGFLTSVKSVSSPALDAGGNLYVVLESAITNSYSIRRYPSNMGLYEHANFLASAPLTPGVLPVGSPILGEPVGGSPAEVYVVTTNGDVHAFRADTLAPLWTSPVSFNITIAPTAQPVLKGNRLWMVGINGEVRAVTVNSNGLNRSAQWPRMHRDNCNSNSHLTTASSLDCF
jgi:hypothetical protein